jgi:purine-cytosine permease-like protein
MGATHHFTIAGGVAAMNLSDKVKQIIAAIAPTLGTALGGPLGGLAGIVLTKALGADSEKGVEEAIASGDPEVLLKLKQAENDFAVQMKTLDIKREQLDYDDRANARAREIAVRDHTPRNLAYMLLGGTMLLIACMLFGFTKAETAIAGSMIGYLIGECKAALQYYFGTSSSSEKKTETISEIAKQP